MGAKFESFSANVSKVTISLVDLCKLGSNHALSRWPEAVINMVNKRVLKINLTVEVSYTKQHTFSKVTVTVFENC